MKENSGGYVAILIELDDAPVQRTDWIKERDGSLVAILIELDDAPVRITNISKPKNPTPVAILIELDDAPVQAALVTVLFYYERSQSLLSWMMHRC